MKYPHGLYFLESTLGIDLSFKIGGEAGQGLQSIGYILAKSLARGGLYIFANQDNMSRIRGGHNFFQIRVSDKPVENLSEKIHLLIALDLQTIDEHQGELVQGGITLYDGEKIQPSSSHENKIWS